MKYYRGITKEDRPIGGGKYVALTSDCLEKYNFLPYNGCFYGFFETGNNSGEANQVHIENIDKEYAQADHIDDVTVVFCSKPLNKPMVIVGWYKNATVFRFRQKDFFFNCPHEYNLTTKSKNVYLIPEDQRTDPVPSGKDGFGEINFWYADKMPDYVQKVLDYILATEEKNQQIKNNEIASLEAIASKSSLNKTEREILAKARIGQGRFRDNLIERDGCCRICGLRNPKLLVASHIKPWAKSSDEEKLDSDNGLLLCAMHDALFDNGLISFDQDGRLIISVRLSEDDRAKVKLSQSFILEMSDKMKKYMKFHLNTWKSESIYVHHTKYGDGIIIDIINGDCDYKIRFDKDYVEGGNMKPITIPRNSTSLELVF